MVLVTNAHSDLFDFNPSPHSFVYHGARELAELFTSAEFDVEMFGSTPIAKVGLKQKLLRPIKKLVISANLMPKTMAGKRILKRLVFGTPVAMPAEVTANMAEIETPVALPVGKSTTDFKVIYCAARMRDTVA